MDMGDGYLTEDQLRMLCPLIMELHKTDFALYNNDHRIVLGNDAVKAFLKAFIAYSLFDMTADVQVTIFTTNNSGRQVLGLETLAVNKKNVSQASWEGSHFVS